MLILAAIIAAIVTWIATKTWWQGFLVFVVICYFFG